MYGVTKRVNCFYIGNEMIRPLQYKIKRAKLYYVMDKVELALFVPFLALYTM